MVFVFVVRRKRWRQSRLSHWEHTDFLVDFPACGVKKKGRVGTYLKAVSGSTLQMGSFKPDRVSYIHNPSYL
jgi:hypothetical protein